MKKKNVQCNKIKNLEKRLACLKDKYDTITKELETENESSTSDEGMIDYNNLLEERRFLENHIERVTSELADEECNIGKSLKTKKGKISIGTVVHVLNHATQLTFKLVSSVHNDDEQNQISTDSPIGKAVLGKRVGDKVIVKTPKGKMTYLIKKIE
jgi:transcription elongation factor GreA